MDGLVDDKGPQDEQGCSVDEGRENLRPLQPEGQTALRPASRKVDRHQREPDRPGVGEHVAGVGKKGEGMGHDADDHLAGHEDKDQGEHHTQTTLVGVRVDRLVIVPFVRTAVCLHVSKCRSRPRHANSRCPPGRRHRR